MYWSFDVMVTFSSQMTIQVMIVVAQVLCIDSRPLNCIPGCCTPLAISCNFSIVLEQHICVLGLCRMALQMHHWMPSPAQYGCCLVRCCALLHTHRSDLLAMQITYVIAIWSKKTLGPCPTALEQHRRMLGMARRGFGLCLLALDVPPWRLRPALYGCCFVRNFAI